VFVVFLPLLLWTNEREKVNLVSRVKGIADREINKLKGLFLFSIWNLKAKSAKKSLY